MVSQECVLDFLWVGALVVWAILLIVGSATMSTTAGSIATTVLKKEEEISANTALGAFNQAATSFTLIGVSQLFLLMFIICICVRAGKTKFSAIAPFKNCSVKASAQVSPA